MIGKLLHGLGWLAVQTCVATVIAAAILGVYFSRAWKLNREKLVQMLAVAQGVDLAAVGQQAGPTRKNRRRSRFPTARSWRHGRSKRETWSSASSPSPPPSPRPKSSSTSSPKKRSGCGGCTTASKAICSR